MSKLVEPEEVGKIFTVVGVLEGALALVAKPLFSVVLGPPTHTDAKVWRASPTAAALLTNKQLWGAPLPDSRRNSLSKRFSLSPLLTPACPTPVDRARAVFSARGALPAAVAAFRFNRPS